MRPFNGIKRQDIVILLKLVLLGDRPWRHVDLADALWLSQPEISFALERCRAAGFLDQAKRQVIKPALLEFLEHGLKYTFPAGPGRLSRGMPTAFTAPPLNTAVPAEDVYVWAWEDGAARGQAIDPLYPNVPWAAANDRDLYELLALVDALRTGPSGRRAIAVRKLQARFAIIGENGDKI